MRARLAALGGMVEGRRLLDVGAGSGTFTEAARERGWDAVGVEPPDSEVNTPGVVRADIASETVPGRPEARPTHARWLRQYLPMVEEGTWAWLDVGDCDLLLGPRPEHVVLSAFAGRELYLALANYGQTAVTVETSDKYAAVVDAQSVATNRWDLVGRSLRILRRAR